MSAPVRPVENVYLGTSEFAASVLRTLAGAHRPALVVTPPDRRSGRGRRVNPPPAAEAARELGIDLHQTDSVNDPESVAAVLAASPELGCVCAFGQLIGEPLISDLPMLNLHPSLLPRWRGAAPIERAIMAGDEGTGSCVMRLTAGLDSGPVALREELAIARDEDYGSLAGRLAELGGRMLVEALDRHSRGDLSFVAQSEEGVTYAEKIGSAERRVDPGRAAADEALRIRALSPHVGAFAELEDGTRLGVRSPLVHGDGDGLRAGRFAADEGRLLLGFAAGSLELREVQPPGGRWMAAADYLRGRGLPGPASSPPPK